MINYILANEDEKKVRIHFEKTGYGDILLKLDTTSVIRFKHTGEVFKICLTSCQRKPLEAYGFEFTSNGELITK